MPRKSERGRQAEIEAARAREIEEERLHVAEQTHDTAVQVLAVAQKSSSAALPDIGGTFSGYTARIVREYVRSVMVPASLKRLFDIGHGVAKFDTLVQGGQGGAMVLQLEAPASVQERALTEIIGIGVPKLRGTYDGEGAPIQGVIVFGAFGTNESPGMEEARRRAHQQRMEDHGHGVGVGTGASPPPRYTAPPGHEIVVIEDDLRGSHHPSPDDAPASPAPSKPQTRAQLTAQKRRNKTKR